MRKFIGFGLTLLCGAMVFAVVASNQVPAAPTSPPEIITIPEEPVVVVIPPAPPAPVPSPPEKVEPVKPVVNISTTITARPRSNAANCSGGTCSVQSSRGGFLSRFRIRR